MKIYNILLGFDRVKDPEDFLMSIRANFNDFKLFEVGKIDLCKSKEELDDKVKTRQYDVVISMESLSKEQLGSGAIAAWRNHREDIKAILILSSDKAGGMKVKNLVQRGCYDCIFKEDFSDGELLAQLIAGGRTLIEAAEYYAVDLPEQAEIKEENKKPSANLSSMLENEDFPSQTSGEDKRAVEHVSDMQQDLMSDVGNIFTQSGVSAGGNAMPLGGKIQHSGMPEVAHAYEEQHPVPEMHVASYNAGTGLSNKGAYSKKQSSVIPHEGFVVSAVSDTVLIIEVPGAHFMNMSKDIANMPINLITPSN